MQTHKSAQHNTTCQTQYTRRDATQYNIIFKVRWRILKLNTTGCYTVPYSTPQYNSMQYNNIQYTATYWNAMQFKPQNTIQSDGAQYDMRQ